MREDDLKLKGFVKRTDGEWEKAADKVRERVSLYTPAQKQVLTEQAKALIESSGISRRFVVAVTPISAPRMTRRDKWKKRPCVEKYFAYRDVLRAAVKVPEDHGSLILMFYIPMPQSWSLKKCNSMDGKWHQSKPDVDNLAKAVLDALFENDCAVWSIHVKKVWTVEETGKVVIHFV